MDNPGYFSDSSRPGRSTNPRSPTLDNRSPTTNPRPRRPSMPAPTPQSLGNVSFQEPERAWRSPPPHSQNDPRRNPRQAPSQRADDHPRTPTRDAWADYSSSGLVRTEDPERPGRQAKPVMDPESNMFSGADFTRKKSLTRPDREKIQPGHRQWHYRNHAAALDEEDEDARVGVIPSTTGNFPQTGLHRGRSLLARDEDVHESGLALFKRGGATLRRKRIIPAGPTPSNSAGPGTDLTAPKRGLFKNIAPGPVDAWMIYCWFLTICIPPFLLRSCGMRTPERQRAWREKMGLMSIILIFMAAVGFLTFGFTQTVCGKPPTRFQSGTIDTASVIIHGYDYDLSRFQHPYVAGVFTGKSNPLYEGGYHAAGMDLSFMFQYNSYACRSIITPANGSVVTQTNGYPDWIFPCNIYNQYGTSPRNLTGYDNSTNCHIKSGTQALFKSTVHPSGQVYYTWDQVKNTSRNLAVYETAVLDLNLLNWLDTSLVQYPPLFDALKTQNGTFNQRDITMFMYRNKHQQIGQCLQQTIVVGYIDSKSIGCVASQVVLYVSLIFIIGVVGIRFGMAVLFGWFVSYKIGAFTRESYSQRMARAAEIENWTDHIYQPAPSQYRPSVAPPGSGIGRGPPKPTQFLPTTSRFSKADAMRPSTTYGTPEAPYRRQAPSSYGGSKGLLAPSENNFPNSRSSMSLPSYVDRNGSNCPFPLHNVIPQPPPDFEPFNFPLLHAICLVTAYSESLEGLRTTLDSLATTDYPNSHKVLMVIADGMVKGAGNDMTTPDIVLSMMKELVVPAEEVDAHSYVSIADGHKRHNMAKVYAGFYDYDDNTVEPGKQQRVPIVLVAKCGNPLEAKDPKPGNRGKRDSQMVLMAFLQKVMFDERMTTFEYEYFNSIWRCTGISPDRYEVVLCVDADTKVFPDSLTRMTACMVHDEDIMGVCGETKIANKSESWVTMIQVFEYYISHHLTKAFESMFGGVTCLPGCFSMYRIKSPKGSSGYWVPILANPDIVEHYSENIVDTLHKKNLLLLGEDRYLTTLMLKTFPKRKLIFCPQAVCKTIVPDTFRILLSQRRRWINSTVHNLAELLLVRDLCGTFCFSMQFVVGMELVGTLVLPAAIAFTLYLLIVTIVPGHSNTTLSLILLAIILGLPGLLIVITSRKIAYIGWMLAYLISLPIWNFVLPAYSFWHFDDFSWGQTRRVSGDGDGHLGDKEGEFDSSHIIMKRWAEFERERRGKPANPRDSPYDVIRRKDSRATESVAVRVDRRYSMGSASVSESYDETLSASRHSQQAMLPAVAAPIDYQRGLEAPRLAEYPNRAPSPSGSSNRASRSGEGGDSSPPSDYVAIDDREPIIPRPSQQARVSPPEPSAYVRQGIPNPSPKYNSEMQNAYRHAQPQAVSYDQQPYAQERDRGSVSARPPVPPTGLPRPTHARSTSRGVTLSDPGVVPAGPESVRRVPRQGKRTSVGPPSIVQPQPRPPGSRAPSRMSSGASGLPPGAAPPQYPKGGQ